MNIWKKIKPYLPDGFITGIILMVLLGYLVPGIGKTGSAIELSKVIKIGIVILFFFYGTRLSPEDIKAGLGNYKLHITIQIITFIVFPVIVLLFYPFFRNTEYYNLWLAVFYLAALPSTVSSSVVMVSIARGNIAGSIFNASISGLIGIIVTPLWMSFFMKSASADFQLLVVIRDLVLQILLPLLIGLYLNRYIGKWSIKNKKYLSMFDKSVILSIVYQSFSNSFITGVFKDIPTITLLSLAIAVICLFFCIFFLVKMLSKWLKFNREDQITILFNGSKKSLVHGSVIASILFGTSANNSLFLVPIMIFHVFQLTVMSIVARKYSKEDR